MHDGVVVCQAYPCITDDSRKNQILLFLFSLPSHPSAVSYDPALLLLEVRVSHVLPVGCAAT